MKQRPILGITLGDAAGIGPEVVQAALKSGHLDPTFDYRVIGGEASGVLPGKPNRESSVLALAALEEASTLVLAGEISGVVTGPVCKSALQSLGFAFPGQTEFFAARAKVSDFAMILTGGSLTVGLTTIHVPLRTVPNRLSTAEIVRTGKQLASFLRCRLGRAPHIAVAGLNPHAGESGTIGREEIDLIAPAVTALGSEFSGPLPPDTVFHEAVQGRFDGVLCMYHDQGLIPLKLHAFHEGVNVTWGLPFVRTSPDHGTAFGIAGKGIARPDSMIAAIRLAGELVLRTKV